MIAATSGTTPTIGTPEIPSGCIRVTPNGRWNAGTGGLPITVTIRAGSWRRSGKAIRFGFGARLTGVSGAITDGGISTIAIGCMHTTLNGLSRMADGSAKIMEAIPNGSDQRTGALIRVTGPIPTRNSGVVRTTAPKRIQRATQGLRRAMITSAGTANRVPVRVGARPMIVEAANLLTCKNPEDRPSPSQALDQT